MSICMKCQVDHHDGNDHCRAVNRLRTEAENLKTDYALLSDDYLTAVTGERIAFKRLEILQGRVEEMEGLHTTLARNHGTAIAERDELEGRVEELEHELAKVKETS